MPARVTFGRGFSDQPLKFICFCHDTTPSRFPVPRFLAAIRLVEEADDLAGDVLAASLLVVHNTGTCQ